MADTLRVISRTWRRRNLVISQCQAIGVASSGIVLVAGIFIGGVMGYQLYTALHIFGAEALLGGSIGVSILREMAPVMTAIMVTGRAGAAMAAELASQRVSEQIDALEVMAVDPYEYLVAPRLLAGVVVVPLLSGFFAAIAVIAAAIIACGVMDLSYATYWDQFREMTDAVEVLHLVVKGAVFGIVLTAIGCFCGFRAQGGAKSVGQATRNTVVASCLCILLSDYILTTLLPFGHGSMEIN